MGTKMIIWRQGLPLPASGTKIIELDNTVYPGPSDSLIQLDGFNVQPGPDGHYVGMPADDGYTEDELDAIHTYAIVRMVINLFETLFEKPIHWSWWVDGRGDPLLVRVKSNDIHARFIKDQRCILLDSYGPEGMRMHNCRSSDLVAHETGHAILDSFLPHLNEGTAEAKGIGEAFCDLAAMFLKLNQLELCEQIIEATHGDLSQSSILSLFAPGYGGSGDGSSGEPLGAIRNAINQDTYQCAGWSPYDHSQVLMAMLYDILVSIYQQNQHPEKSESVNLYHSGNQWMKGVIKVFLSCPAPNPGIKDFGNQLISVFEEEGIDVRKHLKKRGL